jgi:DNA-nicking Smr family endonuclease
MMPKTDNAPPPGSDRRLWHEAMRSVTPLRNRTTAVVSASTARGAAEPSLRLPKLERFSGIDRANAERLKRGRHPIEGRLDLHGMTQAEAHRALVAFIRRSREAGRRCVLVITGRGLGPSGPGVLKSAVPRWLEEAELRRQLLAIAPAQPHHGGAGAFYLMLRRTGREAAM